VNSVEEREVYEDEGGEEKGGREVRSIKRSRGDKGDKENIRKKKGYRREG
jgi:hypothetical protein